MNLEPEDQTIRDYLNGKFSESERLAFEAGLDGDAVLSERVGLMRAEMAASEWMIAEDIRDWFVQWNQEKPHKGGFGLNDWKTTVFLFFALGVFLIGGYFWYHSHKQTELPVPSQQTSPVLPQVKKDSSPVAQYKPEAEQSVRPAADPNYLAIAKTHFREPVLSNMRRAQTDTTQTPLVRAREAYAAGNYNRTLELLGAVDSTRRQSADFLAANALYHLGKYREAETTFARLVNTGSTQYRYPSEWSLLICRLVQLPARKSVFEKQLHELVKNPAHPYYEQAIALDNALKK